MRTIDTVLLGLGNVNRNFLRLLAWKGERLRAQYGVTFRVVGVADSSGVALQPTGFEPAALRLCKEQGGRVCDMPQHRSDWDAVELVIASNCALVIDGSPVNLENGEPGLSVARAALARGISVVLANKAPLVLAFPELQRLAAQTGAGLAYSATVCGALPVINIGQRDLIAADISRLRGIFNSTSNFILQEMAAGEAYGAALAEAQRRGIAEADPTLDVEGWDTANKLVIIANSFLGMQATLQDVSVEGITKITPERIQAEARAGNVLKLVATAEQISSAPSGYRLHVRPEALPQDTFLARCTGWEMGIEMHTDLYGKLYHKIWENEPLPTAAAMLRDAVNLFCA